MAAEGRIGPPPFGQWQVGVYCSGSAIFVPVLALDYARVVGLLLLCDVASLLVASGAICGEIV
jgi:hypothetical protein